MSIVGLRPFRMQYVDRYTPEQARRHEVKPGLTGWAQVNGLNANLVCDSNFEVIASLRSGRRYSNDKVRQCFPSIYNR